MILDLHAHSVKSDDGRAKVRNYCQWIRARGIGIDGFVLTEHRQFDFESDYSALAEEFGQVILKGSEVETEYGHVLVFGVTRALTEAFDFAAIGLPLAEVIAACEATGAVAAPCHPGRRRVGMSAHIDALGIPPGVRIVEVRNASARELHSVELRRAALRYHSSWARNPANLPAVSILLPTRRPALLAQALAAVAAQTYPRLELVLALHGNESAFAHAEQCAAALPLPYRIVPVAASAPLGAVLNAAVAAAGGELLTKMDDDDRYGVDHVWDLVLAREYSRAQLVGKGSEYVYLAASHRTIHRNRGQGEAYRDFLEGGTMLIARADLVRVGGWRNVPIAEDLGLIEDVLRAGGAVYRTHGAGHLLIRHGAGHAWDAGDDYFLGIADGVSPGCDAALAGLPDLVPPPAAGRGQA